MYLLNYQDLIIIAVKFCPSPVYLHLNKKKKIKSALIFRFYRTGKRGLERFVICPDSESGRARM